MRTASGRPHQQVKFVLDCAKPVEDRILDAASLEKFFHDRLKVEGKVNNLGDKVKISRDKSRICLEAQLPFSKRYIKFLTRKYLRRQQLHEYLRVMCDGKNSYQLRYFTIQADEAAEE